MARLIENNYLAPIIFSYDLFMMGPSASDVITELETMQLYPLKRCHLRTEQLFLRPAPGTPVLVAEYLSSAIPVHGTKSAQFTKTEKISGTAYVLTRLFY